MVMHMKTREIESGIFYRTMITTSSDGRTSIVVFDDALYKRLVDIELPCREGEYKDAFKPMVRVHKDVEVEFLK